MASKANLRSSGREAALARRRTLSTLGKHSSTAETAPERQRSQSRAVVKPPVKTPAAAVTAAPPTAPAAPPVRRAQVAVVSTGSGRAQARARRQALSTAGKRADRAADRTRMGTSASRAPVVKDAGSACTCGCGGDPARRGERPVAAPTPSLERPSPVTLSAATASARRNGNGQGRNGNGNGQGKRLGTLKPTGRLLALARRSAQSTRGKAGTSARATTASLARQANPKLSGRELAQTVRAQRSTAGSAGTRQSQPTGRVRPGRERQVGAAQDQPWKVGLSETAHGQRVTGTRVGRSRSVTGDEPSLCREITGTEYMGAEIFREFCQTEPTKPVSKVQATTTAQGSRVTGNEVGRSTRVTGDEPGTCQAVTGTEYLSAEQTSAFCGVTPPPSARRTGQAQTVGGRTVSGVMVGLSTKVTGNEQGAKVQPTGSQYLSGANGEPPELGRVPPKVGVTKTLGGSAVTGTRVGRSQKLTGDEPGSCRLITGDEYVGSEQFQEFCSVQPARLEPPKVGLSTTRKGLTVSGTQTGRSGRVTGDEPGTCKAVTGTPYAGLEQVASFCEPGEQTVIAQRTPAAASQRMTGMRPGIGGPLTGASRGACEAVTGTPYIGTEQLEEACGSGALPGQADYPQPLDGAPWQSFSVNSPARQAFQARQASGVTGTRYDQEGRITGPFGMGTGKITGTEQFRSDRVLSVPADLMVMEAAEAAAEPAPQPPARSRITGEGQAAGSKITGDDWERGDRVTGTEGPSARRRNPTRPGPVGAMAAMAAIKLKRNEEIPAPVSRVTGSSGSTDRGSLITYSGGARG